jgi:hypothetical protein
MAYGLSNWPELFSLPVMLHNVFVRDKTGVSCYYNRRNKNDWMMLLLLKWCPHQKLKFPHSPAAACRKFPEKALNAGSAALS